MKQGVTKENVFKMIEAIGDHSLDVFNYCLHFIGMSYHQFGKGFFFFFFFFFFFLLLLY